MVAGGRCPPPTTAGAGGAAATIYKMLVPISRFMDIVAAFGQQREGACSVDSYSTFL